MERFQYSLSIRDIFIVISSDSLFALRSLWRILNFERGQIDEFPITDHVFLSIVLIITLVPTQKPIF